MTEALVWKSSYRGVVDGQEVRASITNQAASDLFSNVQYLKNVIDQMLAGQSMVIYDQPIDGTATTGMPVYRNASGVWTPAIATLTGADNSTLFELTASAQVGGLVAAKSSSTRGDIIIGGELSLSATTLNALMDGAYTPGIFYLSPTYAGHITASKGVAPVRVCLVSGPDSSGNYSIIVNPEQRSQVDGHSHIHFELADEPAGDPNCVPAKDAEIVWGDFEPDGPYPGVIHVVDNADSSLQGWLPADDAAFDGMTVPADAKFGYNIAQDTDLAAYWPPLPLDGVAVTVDGIGVTDDKVIINSDGIWWMDDTYGHAPWPVNMLCPDSESSSLGPYTIWPVRIELWFTRALSSTSTDAVANEALIATGVQESLEPTALGTNIDPYVLTTGQGVFVLKTGGIESSAAPGTIDANSMLFKLVGRDYLAVGRTPQISLEVVVGASAASTTVTAQDIADALSITAIRMPAARNGVIKDITDVTTELLSWQGSAQTPTAVPADQYMSLRTTALDIAAGEVINLVMLWDSTVLLSLTDEVYVFAVRPVIEW